MKQYILLSVQLPPHDDDQYSKWLTLEKRLELLAKPTKGIEQLSKGVWLLQRDQGKTFAAECIAVARVSGLKAEARFVSVDE